ncbi:MAG: hypothetical protein WBA16_07160 [Nonlabens sp.]
MNGLKSSLLICLLLAVLNSQNLSAQVTKIWEKSVSSQMNWQHVTALGNLVVGTNKALEGVDVKTGKINWSIKALDRLDLSELEEIPASPYLKINLKDRFVLVNQFNGKVGFDTNNSGLDRIVSYHLLPKANSLLITGPAANGTGKRLISVNLANGKTNWTVKDEVDIMFGVYEPSKSEVIVVGLQNLFRFKNSNGKLLWKKPVSSFANEQMESLGGFGKLLGAVVNNVAEEGQDDLELGFHNVPNKDMFIISAQNRFTDGATTYETIYRAYKKSTGDELWMRKTQVGRKKFKDIANSIEQNGRQGNIVFNDEGFIIISKGKPSTINFFDYEEGVGQWGKVRDEFEGGLGINLKGEAYQILESNGNILVASRQGRSNFLTSIDSRTGAKTFKQPVKIGGTIQGIYALDKSNVLYATDGIINIVNVATGKQKWKRGIEARQKLTAKKNDEIYIWDNKESMVKILNEKSQSLTTLSKSKLDFQGKEVPEEMELVDDGILLHSSQNIAKIDYDGNVVFNQYYKAPGKSGWTIGLNIAGAALAGLVSADSYMKSGMIREANQNSMAAGNPNSSIANDFERAYSDYGKETSQVAGQMLKAIGARQKASSNSRDYIFMMTKEDRTMKLLQVSKVDGQKKGEIVLGRDRDPVYAVDEIFGNVYYEDNGKTLVGYSFK